MRILLSKVEEGTIKDYLGTVLGAIPEEIVKANKEDIGTDIDAMTPKILDKYTGMVGYEIPEEYIIETLKNACSILIEGEQPIAELLEIFFENDIPREEMDELKKDILEESKKAVKEAAISVIKKKLWRQKAMAPLDKIANIIKNQINKNQINKNTNDKEAELHV